MPARTAAALEAASNPNGVRAPTPTMTMASSLVIREFLRPDAHARRSGRNVLTTKADGRALQPFLVVRHVQRGHPCNGEPTLVRTDPQRVDRRLLMLPGRSVVEFGMYVKGDRRENELE